MMALCADTRLRNPVSGWLGVWAALLGQGCGTTPSPRELSPTAAWKQIAEAPAPKSAARPAEPSSEARRRSSSRDGGPDAPVAKVNGRAIGRHRLEELLVEAYGALLLDQLIGLELAEQFAAEKRASVSDADIEREFEGALRRLSDPLSAVTPGRLDRAAAERLLESVLAERNMSRAEFDLVIRRNALLRKVVSAEVSLSEEDLRREYERTFGVRARVRHIQVPTLAEVERVRERLAAGDTFADVAARYSANMASAREGGLLEPFSRGTEEVPAIFREAAFSLSPGQVSEAVRVGQWHHLIQLEAILPAEPRNLDEVRDSLTRSWQERTTDSRMVALFEKLYRDAKIEILQPTLRAGFDQRHPERAP